MGRLIFISYRRGTGYELAHLVNAELRSRGVRTFIDVSESDPGQFWPQIKAAIHSCRALVLICTTGSFDARAGDDWVLREVNEATTLGRPIVPVFSQDFRRPDLLPSVIAQATEYNGVSMDTQFHVAAFDHLSQLVGGRKRAEQRRRLAFFAGLATLTLLTAVALGGREIIGLTKAFDVERDARKAADARSEELAKSVSVLEKTDADIQRATEERRRLADEQAESIEALKKIQAETRRATEERDRLAKELADKRERDRIAAEQSAAIARRSEAEQQQWSAKVQARYRAQDEQKRCNSRCYSRRNDCESHSSNKDSCRRPFLQCQDDCVDALRSVCSDCSAER
jgi:pyruvate/2-oxoglutarate dehydrogenase complex dihydrolipoamide acyltransferase (E2) component